MRRGSNLLTKVHVLREVEHVSLLDVLRHRLEHTVGGDRGECVGWGWSGDHRMVNIWRCDRVYDRSRGGSRWQLLHHSLELLLSVVVPDDRR